MIDSKKFFDSLFNNARINAILLMDGKGGIQKINLAFQTMFGYGEEELLNRPFDVLFLQADREKGKPARELDMVLREGSSNDENYLLHKDGTPLWVTGESILTEGGEQPLIMKIFQNVNAKKQLERFLIESNEFLYSIFDAVKDEALLIIDSRMRLIRANQAFINLFGITAIVEEGARLSELGHPFWEDAEVKHSIRDIIVQNTSLRGQVFPIITPNGKKMLFSLRSKFLTGEDGYERQILLLIREESNELNQGLRD